MIQDSGRELDMRNPEQHRAPSTDPTSLDKKGVLLFAATVGRTVAETPTIEVPPQVKKGPEKQYIQPGRRTLYVRLAGVLLAIAATAGPAVDHQINDETQVNLPAVSRDITSIPGFYWNLGKSAVEDIGRLLHKEVIVPPTFDNKANMQAIKDGVNAVQATNEDLAKIQDNITPPPSPTEEHGLPALSQFTLLTPFLLKDGDQISMFKTYIGPGIETSTGKVVEPRWAGTVKFIVPSKGTEIIPGIVDPKAVSIEVFKDSPSVVNGTEYFGGVTILVTRQDGTQYGVGFSSHEDVRSLVPLPILDDAPTFKNTKDMLSKKGLSITGTTPIMKTGIDNALVDFGGSRISSTMSVRDSRFSEIQLLQSPDGKALLPPQP